MEDLTEYIFDTSELLENSSDISQLLENSSDTSQLLENFSNISQSGETIKKRKVGETSLQRIVVNKGGCPKAAVWDDFIIGKSDSKGHYGAKYHYYKQDEVLVSSQLSNSEKLKIRSMVDLSNTNFGGPGDLEICYTVAQESGNMDFDPIEIVESELQLANML
ncbi:11448_t:CDS:2 [Racocetra fulgida]|uniref:11448_t:CDS:1 n=1 Tax=Racocetra fulgida TaxID=60492 RepID=A0A9N9D597_9GLOM|nr:11448_t:CDS:2 [Racocetra fulgida]